MLLQCTVPAAGWAGAAAAGGCGGGSEESSLLTLAATFEPAVDAASATLLPAAEAACLATPSASCTPCWTGSEFHTFDDWRLICS